MKEKAMYTYQELNRRTSTCQPRTEYFRRPEVPTKDEVNGRVTTKDRKEWQVTTVPTKDEVLSQRYLSRTK